MLTLDPKKRMPLKLAATHTYTVRNIKSSFVSNRYISFSGIGDLILIILVSDGL